MKLHIRALALAALAAFTGATHCDAQTTTRTTTGSSSVQPYIIGGKDAAPGAWPWMVPLLLKSVDDSTEAQFCGGTLIASRWVLTAGHCAAAFPASQIQILHGTNELPFGRGDRIDVVGSIIHPLYNDITLEYDFALLKLANDLPGPYVSTVSQANSNLWVGKSVTATIIGWGIASNFGPVLPTKLQQADIPLKSDATCLQNLGRFYKPNVMICGGKLTSSPGTAGGVGSCNGDSGGPLLIPDGKKGYKQLGITSWGLTRECAGIFYGVYSEIPAAEAFVQSRPVLAPVPDEYTILVSDTYADSYELDVPVGSNLTCERGTWSGDEIEDYSYAWYRVDSNFQKSVIAGVTGDTYTTTVDDLGGTVACEITATNAGGSSASPSNELYVVGSYGGEATPEPTVTATATSTTAPAATTTPQATVTATPTTVAATQTPTPTPTATATATATPTNVAVLSGPAVAPTTAPSPTSAPDRVAPKIAKIKLSCGAQVCTVSTSATDEGSGVASVTGRVISRGCGGSTNCGKQLPSATFVFKKTGLTKWRTSIPRLGNKRIRVRVIATDGAGNVTKVIAR